MNQGVLIVDDHELIRRGVIRLLEEAGYQNIFQASNGVEALSLIQQKGNAIHVVILDLSMPKMNGLELVDHLVNVHHITIGIIMFSVFFDEETRQKFFSLGNENIITQEFLRKGNSVRLLLDEVATTLEKIKSKRLARNKKEYSMISERLLEIESQLKLLNELQKNRSGFLYNLGMDVLRTLVIALFIISFIYVGVGDFISNIISQIKIPNK